MRIDSRRALRFVGAMRFLLLLCILASAVSAALPPELAAALKNFRADAPRGWSFTQTTVAEGKSTVERSDAAKPEFDRWSLAQKDGRAPTADETKTYAEMRSRRSRGGTAPKLIEQLDLATLETVADSPERATYRCRLKPGEAGDRVAAFLRATLIIDKPSQTLVSIALASTGEFSPTLGVKIAAMTTTMDYSLPENGAPSLAQKVATHVRGRAFWVKSLDADMTVTFSEYAWAGKK